MTILTVQLSPQADHKTVAVKIAQLSGVQAIYDDWAGVKDFEGDSITMKYTDQQRADVALRTVVAWAGDRKGKYHISSLSTKSVADPLGQIGHLGWECCKDGRLISECLEEIKAKML